jgi:hypothetical protein
MSRSETSSSKPPRQSGSRLSQEVKARIRELARRVRSEAPRQVKVGRRGDGLIAAMQASPCREIDIEPQRARLPVFNPRIDPIPEDGS